MSGIINLDHAAGAPLNKDAKNAIKILLESQIYNTDSSYSPAVELRRQVAELKSKTAKLIGVKSPNLFITSGSSDATKTLFQTFYRADPNARYITTNIEHSSLLDVFSKVGDKDILEVEADGTLNITKLKQLLTEETLLVSVQYVNNETGQVMPIKDISKLIKHERLRRKEEGNDRPIFLHTDASQAAITQDLQIPRLGVDAMSLNGSKFGALPSSGILFVSSDIVRWLSTRKVSVNFGKEGILATISIYHALAHAIEKKNTEAKRLLNLAKTFWAEFQKELPEARLNPKDLKIDKNHSPHIINIYIPEVSGERLVILAGLNNILISTGAACSASIDKPSHVLKALGLDRETIQSSIRVSLGSGNSSEKEVKVAALKLAQLAQAESVKA